MIEAYRFGSITVRGRTYGSDIKIVGGEVIARWRRRESHNLDAEDIADILAAGAEVLVVGMGQPGLMMVDGSLRLFLAEKGVDLIDQPTEQAVKTFNDLLGRGKNVAGAFHLTC